jgi:aryl-alcohol dehydrogenase-like predicted oxidoreductase
MPDIASFAARRGSVAERVPLVLGTMNFGKRTPEDEARRIMDRALERGVTLFDTANAYVSGQGERIVGRALRGRREAALVATKVGLSRVGGEASGLIGAGGRSEGLSYQRIVDACDESLGRLGMDYVDLYYLHVPDRETPIEESLRAIRTLLEVGKIRAWATSNFASWQVLEMFHLCDRDGLPRPILAQQMQNLLVRQLDVEYFAFAAKYGLHTMAFNPLAGGLLAREHLPGAPSPGSRFDNNPMYQRRYFTERLRTQVVEVRRVATRLGMSLASLAYAWLASSVDVDSIVIGPASVAHLEEALHASELRLDAPTMDVLHELYLSYQGTDARYARV